MVISGFSINISRHLGPKWALQIFCEHTQFAEFQPLSLNWPTAEKSRPRKWKGHLSVWRAVKAFSPDVRGQWEEHQGRLSFTDWLGSENQSNTTSLYTFLEKVEYFYWVFRSGSHSPYLMSLFSSVLTSPLTFNIGLAHTACCSQGFTPVLPL